MKFLRRALDDIRPHFEEGGRWRKYMPFYDVIENFLYTTRRQTSGPTQLRDSADVQRIMVIVWLATFPAMFWGMYNVGQTALANIESGQAAAQTLEQWRYVLAGFVSGLSSESVWDSLVVGALWFVPIYVVTFVVGVFWEAIFAVVRGHEINEGFFVTSVLFALSCPPSVPLWQVAIGITFGVVIAKEVFGGTGKNFVNPALAGRAFLYFSYPASWSGDTVWIAADGISQATPLAVAAAEGLTGLTNAYTFFDTAVGTIPGSVGETSLIAIGIGGVILLLTGVASWRIMLGCLAGMSAIVLLFNAVGSETNPMFDVPPHWHLAMGGFAFGLVFMATEPVTASVTQAGRWIYGFTIGVMAILIRVVNPAFPEGMMLAILFTNLCAPLIDHLVIEYKRAKKQRQRNSVARAGESRG